MKAKLLLRIAAGLMVFHTLGHTFGHLTWKEAAEPGKQEVIRQMTEHKFPFMGTERSMGDYYDGYGWGSTITLILLAAVLWILSGATDKALSPRIALTVGISLMAWCIMEFMFFFPFAAGTTLLAAICTLASVWQLRKQEA